MNTKRLPTYKDADYLRAMPDSRSHGELLMAYRAKEQSARCDRLLRLRNSQRGKISKPAYRWLTKEMMAANSMSRECAFFLK